MPSELTFPEVVDTERLLLRRYGAADAPSILDLVDANRELLMQDFSQMAKGLSAEKEARDFVKERAEQWDSGKLFCYGIRLKPEAQLIGQLQVKNILWDVPSAELSYFIGALWQRRGFASEAVAAIVRTAFQQFEFQRLFVRVLPSNQESLALARKLGFQHEGLQRNAYRCGHGKLHDVH